MKYQIKRFANGKYQVWRTQKEEAHKEEVLRTKSLTWEKSYHQFNDFMYFNSYTEAESALFKTLDKETITNVFDIKISTKAV